MKQSRRNKLIYCFLIFGIAMLNGYPLVGLSCAQETNLADRLTKRFADEVREEIAFTYLTELEIIVDKYAAFFELDNAKTRKLKILSKSLAQKNAENYPKTLIKARWNSINRRLKFGTTFMINDRVCVLDGEEKEDSFANIKIAIVGDYCLMSVRSGMSKTTTMLTTEKKFAPQNDAKWLKTIAPLISKDIVRFEKHQEQQLKKMVTKLLLSAIEVDLRLTKEQIPAIRDWIEKSITPKNKGTFDAIARSAIAQLPIEAPKELSDAQRRAWPLVRARLEIR